MHGIQSTLGTYKTLQNRRSFLLLGKKGKRTVTQMRVWPQPNTQTSANDGMQTQRQLGMAAEMTAQERLHRVLFVVMIFVVMISAMVSGDDERGERCR